MAMRTLIALTCLLVASPPVAGANPDAEASCSYTVPYDLTHMANLWPYTMVFDCDAPWGSAAVSVDDLASPVPCHTVELKDDHRLVVTLWAFTASSVHAEACLTTQGQVHVTNA